MVETNEITFAQLNQFYTPGDLRFSQEVNCEENLVDGRVAGHLGASDGLKTLSLHVCVCLHFVM